MNPMLRAAVLRLVLATSALLAGAVARAESAYRLMAPSDLPALTGRFEPGDVVLLPDGDWENATLTFRGKGTAEKPITLRPTHPGKFSLKGASSLVIDGEWLVVEGIIATQTQNGDGATITLKGRNHRLTNATVDRAVAKVFVRVQGTGHQVDHCTLINAPAATIELPGAPEARRQVRLEDNRYIGCTGPSAE